MSKRAEISTVLTGNESPLKAALERGKAAASKFASDVKKTGEDTEAGFSARMGKIGGAIKAAFGAAAVQQFASAAIGALDAAENKVDAIGDFSFATGMSAESSQAIIAMGEQYGVAAEKVAMMVNKVQEMKDALAAGGDEGDKLQLQLAGIGMSLDYVKTASSGDLFIALTESMAKFKDDAYRTSQIVDMIGATGGKGGLRRFLTAAGGGGIDEMKATLAGAGALLTDADIARADVGTNNAVIQAQIEMARSARTRVFQSQAGTMGGDATAMMKDVMTLNIGGLLSKSAQGYGAIASEIRGAFKTDPIVNAQKETTKAVENIKTGRF